MENFAWRPEVLADIGAALPDGRAAAARQVRDAEALAHVPGGPRDGAPARVRAVRLPAARRVRARARLARAGAARRGAATRSPSSSRRRSTASRTRSATSSAAATRPATTATSGPRCSRPTRSRRSRRPACSTARRPSASGAPCSRRAAAARRSTRSSSSAAASRRSTRCCSHASIARHRVRSALDERRQQRSRVKVATWNVNSLRVRLPHVLEWLEREQPDVLALQETKLQDEKFPRRRVRPATATSRSFSGQSAYNGVAILSREPPSAVVLDIGGGYVDEQKRVLGATFGDLRIWSLYVPNGQSVDSDKYRYKLDWLAALRVLLADELARHPRAAARRRLQHRARRSRRPRSRARGTARSVLAGRARGARGALRARAARHVPAVSSSPRRSSAGGTIARGRFAATKAFEST